ncbi:MAG TPA: response regulator transcription factor [Opitutaceae bacterium]|nr:response regulator transcription factor [Opitutaceae bacterium]
MIQVPKSGAARRIYLVDDHPLVREWLANLIVQQADLTVCGQAENAAIAQEEIAILRPDVVVVDLSLKGESGLELIKTLHQQEGAPLILVLSMHDEIFYAERALRAGARGYVMKRETTGKVIEALRKVLDGGMYVSEPLANKMAEKLVGNRKKTGGSPGELLSDRELQIFRLIGQGYENRRISEELHLSLKTVQAYCARIKEKLDLENAMALTRDAVRWIEQERLV